MESIFLGLADASEISQFLPAAQPIHETVDHHRKKIFPKPDLYVLPIRKTRMCKCGICFTCKDNARWERIFAEKFADPSYYSNLTMRGGSSLQAL
jgi:hypothetical protein